MKPLKTLYTDSHYQLRLVYTDADGTPVDITGATATMVLRNTIESAALVTTSATIDGPTGTIEFTIPPEDTSTLIDAKRPERKLLAGAMLYLPDDLSIPLFNTTVLAKKNIVRGA
ncbi:hypothetical protein [Alteromonas sp. RKMC-009]|uniref:hypothetical protein n=1 Tax=Alteromonas sp. RKMC-009 TaxID=2267264 RepID=UPI000E694693|nr:hypothetical protein [Alteromonas sp. RKMC-009]AYA64323.1 hypothetical protein DS731_10110 [Alteromonas sp. RKMC-009]